MSGHTPGPWRLERPPGPRSVHDITGDDYDIIGATDWCVCEAIGNAADARLIAAAPDLLEALHGCLEQCVARYDERRGSRPTDKFEIEAARAALAKARG